LIEGIGKPETFNMKPETLNYLCIMSKSSYIFLVAFLGQILLIAACAERVPGCTDPSSPNYDPLANYDDGTCQYSVPEDYRYIRDEESSVELNLGLSRQLRIARFEEMILAMGESGAVYQDLSPIVFGYPDSLTFFSLAPEVDTMIPSTLGSLASGDSLVATFYPSVSMPDPREIFAEALSFIDQQASGAALGTPAVYTSQEGIDYARLLPPILMGYSLYAPAVDSMLPSADTLDNITVSDNSTVAEGAWDNAFGAFGHPVANPGWYTGGLPWSDIDQNDTLDFSEEYIFSFAREAVLRNRQVPEANFTGRIFLAFRQGRAALAFGPERVGEVTISAIEIRDYWEQTVAANAIHYLNEANSLLGNSPLDSTAYRAAWSAAAGYIHVLGLKEDGRANASELIDFMGSAPAYTATYRDSLETLRSSIGGSYAFPQDWQERF
jgi:hypothetical protein